MESHSVGDGSGRVGPDEALDALLVVERLRRAALRRGLPPRWLGGILSILAGALSGAQAADASPEVIAVLFLSMMLLLGLKRRMLLALSRRSSYGLQMIATQFCGVLLIIVATVGGRLGFARYGLAWAPIAAGATCATVIYILFEFKLSVFRASIEENA